MSQLWNNISVIPLISRRQFYEYSEHSYTWKFMPVLTRMILSTHIDIGDPMKY